MLKKTLGLLTACLFSALALMAMMGALTVGQAPAQAAPVAPMDDCVVVSEDIAADVTWTQSCYRVMTTTVTVLPTTTLTIAPPPGGTRVEFAQNARLQVLGRLAAIGTAADPITFTSSAANPARCDWVGIILGTDSDYNRIEHALIEYACTAISSDGLVYPAQGNRILSNTLRFSGGDGTRQGAIGGDLDYSIIRNNIIYSVSNGIAVNEAGHNTIADNHIFDVDRYGIYMMEGGVGGGTSNQITGNTIRHCISGAIRLEVGAYNVISNNLIYENPGEAIVLIDQTRSSVQANHIYDNGGDAVYVGHRTRLETLSDNVIHAPAGNAVHFVNTSEDSRDPNTFNALCAPTGAALWNDSPDTITAPRNWWGTNAPTDTLHGPADIIPWMTFSVEVTPTLLPAEVGGAATVYVRLADANGNTVPAAAREVQLTSNAGTLAPLITLDADGAQHALLTLTDLPAEDTVVISATAFCDYTAVVTLTLERTNLAVAKTTAITQALPGETVTYRLHYTNTSAVTATDVRLTDTLPAGMVWAGDTAAALGWTRVTTSPPVWTRPALPPDTDGVFVLTTTLAAATCGEALVNRIAIDTATAEITTTDNVAQSPPVTAICPAVAIAKTGDALSKVGDTITYTFAITNTSVPSIAPPLHLDSILDMGEGWPGLGDLASYVPPACHTLAHSDTCRFSVPYTVPADVPNPLRNTVVLTYHPHGFTVPVTATDSHATDLFTPAVAIAKTGDALSKVGGTVTYTFAITNISVPSIAPPLHLDSIFDMGEGWPGLGDLASYVPPACLTLAYLDTCQFSVPYTVPADAPNPLRNTVVLTYHPHGFTVPVTATDSHATDLFTPAVAVAKHGELASDGTNVVYTFHITNTGSANSPPLMLDTVFDVGEGWPGLGDLTAEAQAGGCGELDAGASCVFDVIYTIPSYTATMPGTIPLTNTVTVTYHPLGFPNLVTATDTHAMDSVVDLVVVKDDDVGPTTPSGLDATTRALLARHVPQTTTRHREFVYEGDLITYTIAACNVHGTYAHNVVLTELIPTYTTYVERDFGWIPAGGREYTLHVGTLAPQDCKLTYMVVRVQEQLPPNVNNLDNLVCGWASGIELTPDDNCNHEDTPVRRRPDLFITKTAAITRAAPGEVVTFTLTYGNQGGGAAPDVVITDTLPPELDYVSDTSGLSLTHIGRDLVWTLPATLPVGAQETFTLMLALTDTIGCNVPTTNTARIAGSAPEPDYTNNVATATVTATCFVDLVVIKDDSVGPTSPYAPLDERAARFQAWLTENRPQAVTQHREFIYEGDLVTYTISIYNAGPYTATNIVVTEYLPTYSDYVERDFGWTRVEERLYTQHIASLAPDDGVILYMVVRAHDPIPEGVNYLINRVCAWADEPDRNRDDNCNYEDTPVRRRPLRVSKSAPLCIAPGDYFNYTPRYTNTNHTTGFFNVPMTDTLPNYVTYAGATPGAWTCDGGRCYTTLPSVPANTTATGPQLPVRLSPTFPYTTQSTITNVIEISGGVRFVHTRVVDIGPNLAVVKNDNVGPLPAQQQREWQQMARQIYGNNDLALDLPPQREYVRPGELITYTLLYVNTGIGAARDVVLTEYLPVHTTYHGGGWDHAGGNIYTVNLGTLEPGQGGKRVFVVRVIEDFPLNVDRVLNVARITTSDEECDLSDNTTNEDTPVRTDTLLLVANRNSNSVDVFDTMTFRYLDSFDVGPLPFGMVIYDGLLYASNFEGIGRSSHVTVIDLETWDLVKNIEVGYHPAHITAHDGHIYVSNHSGGESITVINHATLEVMARLRINQPPAEDFGFFGITADTLRGRILATKRYLGGAGLWSISPRAHGFNLAWEVQSDELLPYSVIYNPTTDNVYVAYPHRDEVRMYDAGNFDLLHVFQTQTQDPNNPGFGGHGLAVHGACTYVANYQAESVSVLAEGPCGGTTSSTIPPEQHTIMIAHYIYLPLITRGSRPFPHVATHIPVNGQPKGLTAGNGIVVVTLPEQNRLAIIDVRTQNVIRYVETAGDHPHTAVIYTPPR